MPRGGGSGGSDGVPCDIVTIQLSRPVALSDLSFSIRTSDGDTFDQLPPAFGGLGARANGDPVESLALSQWGEPTSVPTFFDIEVFERGVSVGSARFDQLAYRCHAITADDWCWNAEPVTLVLADD
jgi:hypothetical protein